MYYAIHGKMPLNNLYETEAAAQAGIEQMKKLPNSPHAFDGCTIVEVPAPANLFEIWQMRDEPWAHGYKFFNHEMANKKGYVSKEYYNCVYREALDATEPSISLRAHLYDRFNCDKPIDYMAPSMSVSDVIVFKGEGGTKAFFVEPIGFREIEF